MYRCISATLGSGSAPAARSACCATTDRDARIAHGWNALRRSAGLESFRSRSAKSGPSVSAIRRRRGSCDSRSASRGRLATQKTIRSIVFWADAICARPSAGSSRSAMTRGISTSSWPALNRPLSIRLRISERMSASSSAQRRTSTALGIARTPAASHLDQPATPAANRSSRSPTATTLGLRRVRNIARSLFATHPHSGHRFAPESDPRPSIA